jgi:hypothetical protein
VPAEGVSATARMRDVGLLPTLASPAKPMSRDCLARPALATAEREKTRGCILSYLRGRVEPHTKLDELLLYPEVATRLGDPLVVASMNYDHLAIRPWIALIAARRRRRHRSPATAPLRPGRVDPGPHLERKRAFPCSATRSWPTLRQRARGAEANRLLTEEGPIRLLLNCLSGDAASFPEDLRNRPERVRRARGVGEDLMRFGLHCIRATTQGVVETRR